LDRENETALHPCRGDSFFAGKNTPFYPKADVEAIRFSPEKTPHFIQKPM
jgi:hypothetical protein